MAMVMHAYKVSVRFVCDHHADNSLMFTRVTATARTAGTLWVGQEGHVSDDWSAVRQRNFRLDLGLTLYGYQHDMISKGGAARIQFLCLLLALYPYLSFFFLLDPWLEDA